MEMNTDILLIDIGIAIAILIVLLVYLFSKPKDTKPDDRLTIKFKVTYNTITLWFLDNHKEELRLELVSISDDLTHLCKVSKEDLSCLFPDYCKLISTKITSMFIRPEDLQRDLVVLGDILYNVIAMCKALRQPVPTHLFPNEIEKDLKELSMEVFEDSEYDVINLYYLALDTILMYFEETIYDNIEIMSKISELRLGALNAMLSRIKIK